jgi:nucleoside-diphosphate kinase
VIEHTLAIIKPDAVSRGLVGKIMTRVEEHGFRVRALKLVQLSQQTAQEFYRVHA